MIGKNIIFNNEKTKKNYFLQTFKTHDVDVDKILISKKESYGTNKSFQFFSGCNENRDIKLFL